MANEFAMDGHQDDRGKPGDHGQLPWSLGDVLHQLIGLLAGTDIEELEVETEGMRIRLRRDLGAAPEAAAHFRAAVSEPTPLEEGTVLVTSPVVGVFRRGAGAEGSPGVTEGDIVQAGRVLGSIEAMGISNPVESPESGLLQAFLVADGSAVEYGQPLARLERQPPAPGHDDVGAEHHD